MESRRQHKLPVRMGWSAIDRYCQAAASGATRNRSGRTIVGKYRKDRAPFMGHPIHTYPPTEFVALSVAAPGVERRMMRQDDGTLLTFASRSEAREWVGGLAVVPMRTAKQRGYV